MSRNTKVILWVLGLLIAIPAIALVILLTYDWNKARPWLNAKTSEAIGREFEIRGDLSLTWEKPASRMAGRDKTWRDWIPWPHLVAKDVRVGNPEGMARENMAHVDQFSFSLNPLALLDKRIVVPVLRFAAPDVNLVRLKDGTNNWTFKHENKPSPWRLDVERVVFTKGVVRYRDAIEQADITADVDLLERDPTYGVGWKVRGTFNDAPVTGSGKAGAVLSLKQQLTPYPLQGDVRIGAVRIAAEGTLTKPTRLAALDFKLKLAGPSMARLYPIIGVVLPETPAFSTEGRLLAALDDESSRWDYDKFRGKVGSSDIGGQLVYQTGKPRGKLTGNVVSSLLQFADLGPLIGADSNASKTARGVAPVQPSGKVLPVETFRTGRWTAIDADVRYSASRIIRDEALPIRKLSTHLILKNGVLHLNPLTFDMAGGTLSSVIKLDGSGREGKNAIRATANVNARRIKIKELFPTIPDMQATIGEINGDARLSATGNSVASLLAASNGEVKTMINQGAVSKLLLEKMGLNIGNIILTTLFGDKQVKLNCMATDFGVRDGVMQTRVFVVDTEEALITADGTINLATEQINMTLRPRTKGLRIVSLRAPLYVRGPFKQPDVSVDKGVLAMKAGGAIALGLAAPLAALLPLINAGPGKDSDCARLLAMASEKPQAPPPGKTAANSAARLPIAGPNAQNVVPRATRGR
ncbi:AsmA family protein [Massilia sp. PAMC28688]|uniref:AsmA family protein n=1 Tax=Massilia sp. PAMC28688 TaxID=2861283 RepID=UPI001C632B7E|nr:AsmA family protein [Massilia sp. PAMC28688]QYF93830.1 AsmA family protein [Massilia sp. PAMC28688]